MGRKGKGTKRFAAKDAKGRIRTTLCERRQFGLKGRNITAQAQSEASGLGGGMWRTAV